MAQRNSTRQFQQWSAHGQLRGLATSGQPGALHAGLGHGTASPLATSAVSGRAIGWLRRRAAPRFWITTCISSSPHREGARRGHRLGANAGVRHGPGLRRLFGRPLRAATPTCVLLASHRCLAGAAQAWEVSVDRARLSTRSRERIARRGVRWLYRTTALPSLREKLLVGRRSADRRPVSCAKSLRRSGEVA